MSVIESKPVDQMRLKGEFRPFDESIARSLKQMMATEQKETLLLY